MGQESVEFQPAHSALFAPGVIGGVTLRNRVVMPAMTTRLADAEDYVTEEQIAYYLARARRGRAAQGLRPARAGQKVLAIGDAVAPAKGKQAIESAFRAALFDPPAGA
jgi:2,4-dienoyl-CoA reductase-like NADH-dependent reductase (Old Yellow Enzyme family)